VQRAWEARGRHERRGSKRIQAGPGADAGSGEGVGDGSVVKKARGDGGVEVQVGAGGGGGGGGMLGRGCDEGEREREGGREGEGEGEGEGGDGPKGTQGTEEQGSGERVKLMEEEEGGMKQERRCKIQGDKTPSDLNQTDDGGKMDNEESDGEWRRETSDVVTRTIAHTVWASAPEPSGE
jgi:hypothetical protein